MKNIKTISGSIILILSLLPFFTGCSSIPEVVSTRNNNDIKIDGKQEDWGNSFIPVKDENVAVAFKNDGENLYICFITSDDQKIVKIMSSGLTTGYTLPTQKT